MSTLDTVVAGSGAAAVVNENFQAVSAAGMYGRRAAGTSGLTWGYYGGRGFGNTISDGTVSLTASTTNYVVASRSTGAVSTSTSTTNWNDTTNYLRLYQVVTGASTISSFTDYRECFGSSSGGGSSSSNTVSALSIASGVVNIDCSLGDYFTLALTANVTSITFSNLPGSGKGASLMVRITQDTTARTVAWPSSFQWEAGTAGAVSTGSGAIDVLAITTFDNGTKWQATLSKGRA